MKDFSTHPNRDNLVIMMLKYGDVVIELLPDVAPKHVARFKQLTNEGFYDCLPFHRVIKGFMAQTGDPTGTGTGGTGVRIADEISELSHKRGVVSMANAGPGTDDSQFFITFAKTPWLDKKHTIFGRVLHGLKYVDQVNGGGTEDGSHPNPDGIIAMRMYDNVEAPFNPTCPFIGDSHTMEEWKEWGNS